MIPLYLKLTNFMPYPTAALNFSGIHIGCLTGDNGAGKSSLLDAITWALWGRSRSKRDDELVHQGQTEMQVEFAFELSGNAYRAHEAAGFHPVEPYGSFGGSWALHAGPRTAAQAGLSDADRP